MLDFWILVTSFRIISIYMEVYGRILEFSNGIVIYVQSI
jgi:hypothetical protein